MLEDRSELSAGGGDEEMMPVKTCQFIIELWTGDSSRCMRGVCVSERQGVKR